MENEKIIEELENILNQIGENFYETDEESEKWKTIHNEATLACFEIVEKRIEELKK